MSERVEQDSRDMQREIVWTTGIKNTMTRGILRQEIPSNKLLASYEFDSLSKKKLFTQLAQNEGGNIYKHILGIASVAETPAQLANAFGALQILSSYREDPVLDQAQNEFLGMYFPPQLGSEKARDMESRFVAYWNQSSSPQQFFNLFHEGNRLFGEEQKTKNKYISEAMILTLTDPHVPVEMRKVMLQRFRGLNFTQYFASKVDDKFLTDASIWKVVDASWVYPELFNASGKFEGDPKDQQIALLKAALRKAESQTVDQDIIEALKTKIDLLIGKIQSVDEDYKELLRRAEQSRQDLLAENERLRAQQPSRPSPFMRLSIDRSEWDSADLAGKRRILDDAYRPLLHKYHPDKHPSVRTDPVVKELVDANMADINKAVNDLEITYKIPKKV